MIDVIVVLLIILFHWLADFVMQDGEWAVHKSHSMYALLAHTMVYTICWFPFCIFCKFYCHMSGNIILFMPITFAAHTITDYFTSKKTSKEYQKQNWGGQIPRGFDFYVTIGFDQALHFIQLVLTFYLLQKWH